MAARTRTRNNITDGLYLESGYLNWDFIMNRPENFILIIGGRGSGKTYGGLEWHVNHNRYFIFSRRTATQVKLCCNPKLNPFKRLNRDKGWNYQALHVAEDVYTFSPCEESMTKTGRRTQIPIGDDISTIIPLSTFSNTRGVDVNEAESWIVDELIPEKNERPIQNEGECYLNAYETMNRNRELEGRPPIKAIFMSNSNTLKNPLLLELELVGVIKKMADQKRAILSIKERDICIIRLDDSPISAAKADTTLYRLTRGTNFQKMALYNEFAEDLASDNKELSGMTIAKNYEPYVKIAEIVIYKLLNLNGNLRPWYVSRSYTHLNPDTPSYTSDSTGNARFLHKYMHLWRAYMNDTMLFEDYLAELLFQQYFKR